MLVDTWPDLVAVAVLLVQRQEAVPVLLLTLAYACDQCNLKCLPQVIAISADI